MSPLRSEIEKISFQNVSFLSHGEEIISNATIDFKLGGVTHIIGPPGKSLFLKLIAGVIPPTSGALMMNDQNFSKMTFQETIPFRLNVGYSFDSSGLIQNMTLRQNLSLPLTYHQFAKKRDIDMRVEQLSELFGFRDLLNKRPSMVTGSIRKSVVVARSLSMNPNILVLDEPTVGLKTDLKVTLLMYLQEMSSYGVKHVFIASEDQLFVNELEYETLNVADYKSSEIINEQAG